VILERVNPPSPRLRRGAGIEAFTDNPQTAENQHTTQEGEGGYTQIRAQIEKPLEPDLAAVVAAWPSLSAPLKSAIVAIANTATNKGGQ
jgi:hypothetical protein